jgi:hypothetical protein
LGLIALRSLPGSDGFFELRTPGALRDPGLMAAIPPGSGRNNGCDSFLGRLLI